MQNGIFNADIKRFCSGRGLGLARFALLQASLEIARRHFAENLAREDCLTNPKQTVQYLRSRLRDHTHEVFACLMLDNRNRVIAFRELFRGTIDGASVYPREILKTALQLNAAAVILSHNHPSGITEASQADKNITVKVKDALNMVDIRTLDHIIVGGVDSFSFAEGGLL